MKALENKANVTFTQISALVFLEFCYFNSVEITFAIGWVIKQTYNI